MSNDLEIEFSEEFDAEQEDVKEILDQHIPVGQLTILEDPETGLSAYHTAMFESPLEGANGELSDAQLLFNNICVLVESYLSETKH